MAENVRTMGPLVPENFWGCQKIVKLSEEKKKRVYWPGINVNFLLAENILNLRKTDALINWNPPPPPHTLEKCEGYMENNIGFCNKPFP